MEQQKTEPIRWSCGHRAPMWVTTTESGVRARCERCDALGPIRADLGEAMRALREMRGLSWGCR